MNTGKAIALGSPLNALTEADERLVAEQYRAVTGLHDLTTAEVVRAIADGLKADDRMDPNGVRVFANG